MPDDPVKSYLELIGELGDPRGEPLVLYPADMEYLDQRIKELEQKIAELQLIIDEKLSRFNAD